MKRRILVTSFLLLGWFTYAGAQNTATPGNTGTTLYFDKDGTPLTEKVFSEKANKGNCSIDIHVNGSTTSLTLKEPAPAAPRKAPSRKAVYRRKAVNA